MTRRTGGKSSRSPEYRSTNPSLTNTRVAICAQPMLDRAHRSERVRGSDELLRGVVIATLQRIANVGDGLNLGGASE